MSTGSKILDGISREFRYAEYKLRKMHSDKKKEKKKNKSKHFSSQEASSSAADYQFKEYSDAMPSDKTEEALQVQVALAISKEEVEERGRKEESDDIRLKLALEESEKERRQVEEKVKKMQQEKQDPWGGEDLFSAQPSQQVDPWGGGSSSGLGARSKDDWEFKQPSAPPQQQVVQSNDSFSDLFSTNQQPSTNQSSDPWGNTAIETNNNFDPFASNQQPAQPFDDFSANQKQPISFDPLAEFDSLHIDSQPAVANGNQTASRPNFFLDQTLVAAGSNGPASVATAEKKAPPSNGFFDGAMSDLVNMNSLLPSKPVANPYEMTKDPSSNGMATRNPFMVRGPQPSLNELSQNNGNLFPSNNQGQPFGVFGGQGSMQPANGNFVNSQNPF